VIDLDDLASIEQHDPHDALGVVERTSEQWREAMARARAATGLPTKHGITAIIYCGMGGSGIAGDVLCAIAATSSSVPAAVCKGYRLPAWVNQNTLVICASYSGNTEETLACFDQALERRCRIVALTCGGQLAERARASGVCTIVPVEGLQPRQALASLAAPALIVAQQLGLLPDCSADLAETEGMLAGRAKELGRSAPAETNEAKRVALALHGKIPLVWGQEGVLAVAAERWRAQLNENAKVPAFSSVLPELDHNEIVGYAEGTSGLRDVAIVALRSPGEDGRIVRRIDATLERAREFVGEAVEARATGESPLARLMSAIILGDFVSVYLAVLRGVDPTPVDAIEELKRRLA